jgi:hypothetical protein
MTPWFSKGVGVVAVATALFCLSLDWAHHELGWVVFDMFLGGYGVRRLFT